MTNRRRSATTRSVPAQTSEQLLELTQEHIRPLIGWLKVSQIERATPALRGTLSVLVGRHGAMNPAGKVRTLQHGK
jgi:hypothetical protein